MNLLLAFILAMAITIALIPLLTRLAGRMDVLDQPGDRKVHASAMPRIGGIAMFIGAFLPLCFALEIDRRVFAYLVGSAVIFFFGVWDDRRQLSATAKLLGQIIAVFIVIFGGNIRIASITLAERVLLPELISVPLTVFFLLGSTNAINLSDGLDGLAGGTTLLCCSAIALLAYSLGLPDVTTIAVVVAGSILGFLRFNTYPARIFMGDAGSQFLGFTVAVLSLLLTQTGSVVVSTALPLLLLGLPIVDTLMVMLQRMREGRSPFSADKKHIHHKLLGLGFDHHEAVAAVYAVQAVFFLAAWFARFEPDVRVLAIFALLAGGVLGLLLLAGRLDWRWRRLERDLPSESRLRGAIRWLSDESRLPRWTLIATATCVLGYLMAIATWADPPAREMAWLTGIIGTAGLAGTLLSRQRASLDWVLRGALYLAVMLAVYLDYRDHAHHWMLPYAKWTLLPLLVVSVVLGMRLSGERRFTLTTLDVLLIFIAIVLPNLPGLAGATGNLGFSLLKFIALVYGIELCVDRSPVALRAISGGVTLLAIVLALRTWG